MFQFGRMLLCPFGRAQQHRLLGVPTGINDRALRPPALLRKSAESLSLGQQRDLSGQGGGRTEYPAVVMIAANDPLVGPGRTLHRRDNVIDGPEPPVRLNRQVYDRWPRSYMISDRQCAAPQLRSDRAA